MMRGAASLAALAFVFCTCGSLPPLALAWRDEHEATSLHVRADGKQMRTSFAQLSRHGKQTRQNLTSGQPEEEPENTGFIKSHLPRKGEQLTPGKIIFLAVFVSVILLFCITSCMRLRGQPDPHENPHLTHTEKQGQIIDQGTVLVCITKDTPSNVFEDMMSDSVIDKVEFGKTVTVKEKPKERKGQTMVSIEPTGAVVLAHFQVEKAVDIKHGTILTCNGKNEHAVNVFRALDSNTVVGSINKGEKVVALKPAAWCQGWQMVPLRPRGAVELEFFTVEDKVLGEEIKDEEKEGLAPWVKEQMEDDVEIDAKLKELRSEKTKLLMEQAMRKMKLERVIGQMMEHQAELENKLKPSAEEIAAKADKIMADVDMAAQRNALKTIAYAAPLVTQSQKIYAAIEKSKNDAAKKGAEIVLQESKNAFKEMQSVVGLQDMEGMNSDVMDNLSIPSVAAMLASAFAPGQLKFLYAVNYLLLILSVIFVLIDLIVLILDSGKPCQNTPKELPSGASWPEWGKAWIENIDTNHVYMWFFIDFFVHFLCVVVRAPVVLRIKENLKHIQRPPESIHQADPFKAIMLLYDFYMTTGTTALVELDQALSSYGLFLSNWSIFFDICWLIAGTDLEWNTPWHGCEILGVSVLRFRVTLFQMLFVFYLIQLVFFLLGQVASGDGFAVAVIGIAHDLDESLFVGLPIFTVVSHALLARGMSDMILIQLTMQKMERDRIQKEKEAIEEQLAAKMVVFEKMEQEVHRLEEEHEAHGGRWQGNEKMQEEYEHMHAKAKERTANFTRQLGERSVKASENVEKQLEQWENGEGGELIEAIGRGEGWAKASEIAAQVKTEDVLDGLKVLAADHVDVDALQKQAADAHQQAQAAAGDLDMAALQEAAQANAASAAAAASAGAKAASAAQAAPKSSSAAAAPRRTSTADDGAGGPPPKQFM